MLLDFQPFVDLGYTKFLLPIARAGASLSPYSHLTTDKLGKTPTLPTEDGWVGGVGWPDWQVSRETVVEWVNKLHGEHCNIGINARIIHGADVDTKDADFARLIFGLCGNLLRAAQGGMRVGRAPGFLIPFRPATPRHKARIVVVHQETGERSAVELLGVGQQWVVWGIHPGTGKPYQWYPVHGAGGILPTMPFASVPVVPDALVDDWWQSITLALEGTPWALVSHRQAKANGHASAAPGELMAPTIGHVVEALRWLKNDPGTDRDRDDWVSVGFAVAAATAKSAEGWDEFERWSRQWRDDQQHAVNTERLWASIDPGHCQIGWPWLAQKAGAESCGRFTLGAADDFAEDVDADVKVEAKDGGLFADPVKTRPTRADVDAAIAELLPGDGIDKVEKILSMMAQARLNKLSGRPQLLAINGRVKPRVPMKLLEQGLSRAIANETHGVSDVGQRLANFAMAELRGRIAFYRGGWWQYDERTWARIGSPAELMRRAMVNDPTLVTQTDGKQRTFDGAIASALRLLESMTSDRLTPRDDLNFILRPIVNLANCTLWMDQKSGEITARKHSAEDCQLSFIDIDYDPSAKCPRYDATLADMVSKSAFTLQPGYPGYDEIRQQAWEATEARPRIYSNGARVWRSGRSFMVVDVVDMMRLVNECLGVCLITRRFRQCIIFKGSGYNGKSKMVVTTLLSKMESDVLADAMGGFANEKFAYSQVMGKRVVMEDDLGKAVVLPDRAIKQLSDNSLISDRGPYGKHAITFINTAQPFILTNSWPRSQDLSPGMLGRCLIVPFNRVYAEEERVNDPWPAIGADRKEMSGILNHRLAAVAEVIKRGYIKTSLAADEARGVWLNHINPVRAFINDRCVTEQPTDTKSGGESARNLYQGYFEWYSFHVGHARTMGNQMKFREDLEHLAFIVYPSNGELRIRGLWLKQDHEIVSNVFTIGRRDDAEDPE